MRNVKRIAALGALLLATACGEPSNGPAAFVRSVYAPYIADAQGDMGLMVDDNITASLKSVLDTADAFADVDCRVTRPDANTVVVEVGGAPPVAGAYRVVVGR